VVTQALLGGDVQFVRLGANSVVQASLRGANLKMIGKKSVCCKTTPF
jgi:hypothetical protein